jgi:hypothetical protein
LSNQRVGRNHARSSRGSKWYVLWPVWALCTILLTFSVFLVVREYREDLPQKGDIPVIALADGQNLHMHPHRLSSPQLQLFDANASGQKVKFLVQRTPDQIVHVAVASCKVCYRNRDSHYARNTEMNCSKCKGAMVFDSKRRQANTSHCAPVELPHAESDGDVAV